MWLERAGLEDTVEAVILDRAAVTARNVLSAPAVGTRQMIQPPSKFFSIASPQSRTAWPPHADLIFER